jgi:hypothetical protein
MIQAYINYPNPHVRIHARDSCSTIQQQRKERQRVVELTPRTLSEELLRFQSKHYRFSAEKSINDMWLRVEFGDEEFEVAIVQHIRNILAQWYRPFANVPVDTHCERGRG